MPNWRLQEARMNAGLSIEQLAVRAGIPSAQTVYDVENGVRRPTMTTCSRIASALSSVATERGEAPVRVTDLFVSPLAATR
jgi:DNA-binding XRE family transcriptional regulator